MPKSKYGKYIISNDNGRPRNDTRENEAFNNNLLNIAVPVSYLDSKMLKDAFYADCIWYHTASNIPVETHVHDFNEILAFFGSNPADYSDLCGEVELWLGDEKHILTKSCMVFIPKGLKHCPLVFRRIDRPIFHFAVGTSSSYTRE
jgi:hypothetical protein